MDILALARAMGKAIQMDERFLALQKAKEDNDNDTVLQEQIEKFNLTRANINQLAGDPEKNSERLTELDRELHEVYEAVMQNPNMVAFNAASDEIDLLMNNVNRILVASVNGEDPDAINLESCTGCCDGCAGCH